MVEFLVDNLALTMLGAGLVLMALEALSPGAHLIVIGVALVGAGLIGVLFPVGGPLVLAALTLLIGSAAAWVYREFDFYGGKGTARTSDSNSLAGATGYVTKTVTGRSGEVKLDQGGFDPHYSARTRSGPIEEGEEVIVIDPGGGNVLTVESLGALEQDEIDRELAREAARQSADADGANGTDDESRSNTVPESTDRPVDEPATETEKSNSS